MLDSILFGDNYSVINYIKNENEINIYLEPKSCNCICPNYKSECSHCHSTHIRHIQDTPLHNTTTWINVIVREFECDNPNCEIKTFSEEIPFATKNKVMTDSLIQLILSISIYLSASTAALVLSFLGVKVSHDTVNNITKSIVIVDNPDVEEVGIDDVAIRKGQSYATAIYDMKDHHLIALLEGRDAENLKEWLKNHKKIKKVARDRASAYAIAIKEILPDCMQVADRFHIFQNLIEYLKDIFYADIPDKIVIRNNEVVDKKVQKIPSELSNIDKEKLNELNYDNSTPIDEFGNIIEFDNKKRDLDSKQYVEQRQRRIEKKNLVINVRTRLKEENTEENKEKIANEFGINYNKLLKYEQMTEEEVEKLDQIKTYKKRKTLFDNYSNMIFKMLKDGISQEYVVAYILKQGYTGSIRGLVDYVNLVAKNNGMTYRKSNSFLNYEYPSDVIVIKRYDLLKFVLTLNSEKQKDKIITQYFDIICKKYPTVKKFKIYLKIFMTLYLVKMKKCLIYL